MSTKSLHPPPATSGRLGRPILTTWEAIAQSLAIGPIFSIAFVATLVVGAAGAAAPLSILLAAIGMLCLGWVITLYARRYAGAGAFYDYLRHISPLLGIFAAGLYFSGILVLAGVGGYPAIGLLASKLVHTAPGATLPWWMYTAMAACCIFLLNHFGIRLTTRVQLTLTGLSVLPLLLLAVTIILKGGDAGNTLEMFNPARASASRLLQGVLFAITTFNGSVVPFPQWLTSLGVYGSLAVLVLTALWTLAMARWRPEAIRAAALLHAWEEQPDKTTSQQAAISPT